MAAGLDLWLYGVHVAQVSERRTGKFTLRYTEDALERWSRGRPLLSVSLPLTPDRVSPSQVGPFLEGLLPEGESRAVLEERYGLRRGDVAGLLAAIGLDCAGAVQVVPAGAGLPARPAAAEPITDGEVAARLRALPERPLGDDDEVRVSLAGQQPKLLLHRRPDGGWALPSNGLPSTHILKQADSRYPGMAANEVLCLNLARELGLTTIEASLLDFDGIEVVAVSRYDRHLDGRGQVMRSHQEDACQALGIDVGPRGSGKYESEGGPSLGQVAALLDVHNGEPEETGRLLEAATFTVAIGNADGHGKNLSLLLPPDGRIRLSPLYDQVCTVAYPYLDEPGGRRPVSTSLAMSIDAGWDIDAITVADLEAEGRRWHFASDVRERVAGVLERFPDALRAAAPTVPGVDELAERLQARALILASGRPVAQRS